MARGFDQKDPQLFSVSEVQKLKKCMTDTVFLLNRGYSLNYALKFTANHYCCPQRQILMLSRAICSDHHLEIRKQKEILSSNLADCILYIDGFNLLITLEILHSGGTLFVSREGCIRDIAGMRGSYHLIDETDTSIALIAEVVNELQVAEVVFYLDSPISNSGNLKTRIFEYIHLFNCLVSVELVYDPDRQLYGKSVVVSADGIVLDNCKQWFNFAKYCINKRNIFPIADFSYTVG